MVPDQASIFAKMLIKFIQDNEITVWYSVPSILIYLLIHGNLKKYRFPNLRLILFAGEVFPIKYLRELYAHAIRNNIEEIQVDAIKKIGPIPLFRY